MTTETWENINALWLEFDQFLRKDLTVEGLSEFCDWVKARSHLFRGVCFGTMLRDEAFSFVRLGTFIERADNTARLLNIKYDFLMPVQYQMGGTVDYYEWSAVLRSVSAFQAYQKYTAMQLIRYVFQNYWCCVMICRVHSMLVMMRLCRLSNKWQPIDKVKPSAWRASFTPSCITAKCRIFSSMDCMNF